jgi:hypothetical protein
MYLFFAAASIKIKLQVHQPSNSDLHYGLESVILQRIVSLQSQTRAASLILRLPVPWTEQLLISLALQITDGHHGTTQNLII